MTSWRKCCCTDEGHHLDQKRPLYPAGYPADAGTAVDHLSNLPVLRTHECPGRGSADRPAHSSDRRQRSQCTELFHRHQPAPAPHSYGNHRGCRVDLCGQHLPIPVFQSACHTGHSWRDQRHLCGRNSGHHSVVQHSGNTAHCAGVRPCVCLLYPENCRQERWPFHGLSGSGRNHCLFSFQCGWIAAQVYGRPAG